MTSMASEVRLSGTFVIPARGKTLLRGALTHKPVVVYVDIWMMIQ